MRSQKALSMSRFPQFTSDQFDAVAIASSTGGPQLVEQILCGLPADLAVPVLVAQHMPETFTESLTLRVGNRAALGCYHAEEGMPVHPGVAYIGRGGNHLRVKRLSDRVSIRISPEPASRCYKPSADELFESCTQAWPGRVLAIVLTGMGKDGVEGAARLVEDGGTVITQDKESCVIYGMPKACDEAGLSSASLTVPQIIEMLLQLSPTGGKLNFMSA